MGLPQGSPLSPILANVVLHEFDQYVMEELKPNFEKGKIRRYNPEYDKLSKIIRRKTTTPQLVKKAMLKRRTMSNKMGDPMDPNFKRLMYVRYADDFVLLVIGSYNEAEEIRNKNAEVLHDRCKATLNMDKSIITQLTDGFHFLGADIHKHKDNSVHMVDTKSIYDNKYKRRIPLRLFIKAPINKIIQKLVDNGFARRNSKKIILAKGRTNLVLFDFYTIISFYNSKINGILNAYGFAGNISSLHRVFRILRQSCALTLALKFKLRTMKKAFEK